MSSRRPDDPFTPPPVESLSDVSWARIERSVFAELDAEAPPQVAAKRRWRVAAIPLVAGGFVAAAAAAAAATWISVTGEAAKPAVTATAPPSVPPPAAASHQFPARITTADAPTELSFGDAVITAAPETALVLGGTIDQGVLIVLERGAATFEVAPRVSGAPFRVQAGEVMVRVTGTRFTVARYGDDAKVEVFEGVVEVIARGDRAMLKAGQAWPTDTAAPAIIETPVPAVDKARRPVERMVTSKEQFEAAARLEHSDVEAALAQYDELARGRGPWAANALYAAGRLAFDHADTVQARRLLDTYLHRFPRGGNAADARALLRRLQGD